MSYLLVSVELQCDFELLCEQLEMLGYFSRTSDWHEKKLKSIDKVGLPRDCHPAKSILRDKERVGKSYAVDFVLSSGRKLDGQLRPTGLLVSDKKDRQKLDADDEHLKKFLEILSKHSTITNIEVN